MRITYFAIPVLIGFIAASGCCKEDEKQVQSLSTELDTLRNLQRAQAAKLTEQAAAIETQNATIEKQNATIEALRKKVDQLFAPTSSAIQLLDDFLLALTIPNTDKEAESQCEQVNAKLDTVLQRLPAESRVAVIVITSHKLIHAYPATVFGDLLSINTTKVLDAVESLSIASGRSADMEDRRDAEKRQATIADSKRRLEADTNEFRQKIATTVSLLKEQLRAMQ